MNLAGKNILITAAATRTGNGIARHLLEEGANLSLNFRTHHSALDNLLEDFPKERCGLVPGDVTTESGAESILKNCPKKLHALINIVGDYHEDSILNTDFATLNHVIQSNLVSVFLMCKAAHSQLKASGSPRIINFGYAFGDRVVAAKAPFYHIAKMGVISLSKSMAKEWGQDGFSVNSISLGTLENSIVMESNNPADFVPQGRLGKYEDIFPVIDMLLSDKTGYITGTNIVISGGYSV